MWKKTEHEFIPVPIAVVTLSDSRTEENDTSSEVLVERLTGTGHALAGKPIAPDNIYRLREVLSHWIADPGGNAADTVSSLALLERAR